MNGGAGQAAAPTISHFRRKLYANTWYIKLLILWYLLSTAIAADLLYNIPFNNGASALASPRMSGMVLDYFVMSLSCGYLH
jgi:hypothetical protein